MTFRGIVWMAIIVFTAAFWLSVFRFISSLGA